MPLSLGVLWLEFFCFDVVGGVRLILDLLCHRLICAMCSCHMLHLNIPFQLECFGGLVVFCCDVLWTHKQL